MINKIKNVLILVSLFFAMQSLSVAEEIVLNKKGQKILLKDDGTWETVKEEIVVGKVLIKITSATDNYFPIIRKDNFDDFSHYENYVGCKYSYSVENRLQKKILFNGFLMTSDASIDYISNPFGICGESSRCFQVCYNCHHQVIYPDEIYKFEHQDLDGNLQVSFDGLYSFINKSPALLSAENLKLYFEKFGCRAHKDKLSVIMSQDKITNEIYPIIEFSSSEMIKPKDTYSFIEVPSSVHALQKKF